MFYSITGRVVHTDATSVAVDCGGVAFNCSATTNTLRNIGAIGDTVTLYTYLNVREDAMELFGFADDLGRVHAAEHDAAVLRQAADQIRHIIVPPIGYTA